MPAFEVSPQIIIRFNTTSNYKTLHQYIFTFYNPYKQFTLAFSNPENLDEFIFDWQTTLQDLYRNYPISVVYKFINYNGYNIPTYMKEDIIKAIAKQQTAYTTLVEKLGNFANDFPHEVINEVTLFKAIDALPPYPYFSTNSSSDSCLREILITIYSKLQLYEVYIFGEI